MDENKKKNGKPGFTKDQREEFTQYAKTMMDWLGKNCQPHTICVITSTGCKLVKNEEKTFKEEVIDAVLIDKVVRK